MKVIHVLYNWKNAVSNPYAKCVAIVGLGITLFLAIALSSYHESDPSFLYYQTEAALVHNSTGFLGAQAAACLLYLLGTVGSYFMLVIGSSFLVLILSGRSLEWDRLIAGALAIMSMPALCAGFHTDGIPGIVPGGLIGIQIRLLLNYWFEIGTDLFLYILLFSTTTIVFRFPFIQCIAVCRTLASYLFNKQYVWNPLYKAARVVGHATKRPIVWCGTYFYTILSGQPVRQSKKTVLDFEYDELSDHEDALDPFWQEFLRPDADQSISYEHASSQAPDPFSPEPPTVKSDFPKEVRAASVRTVTSLMQDYVKPAPYKLPSPTIFIGVKDEHDDSMLLKELEERAATLEQKLERFGIYGKVTAIKRGPVVTLFEYQPQIDSKISKIIALEDDLALALQALSIRIIAPIPGRSVVGFEVANKKRKQVSFAQVIQSKAFADFKAALPLILGEDTSGTHVLVDLARMPHLLIAGSTGSGKSVALNAMLMTLLCRHNPDHLKLILIDPKRLEFAPYADIPHLVFPIVTQAKKAVLVLNWVVQQMEQRYERMAQSGARNIFDYQAQQENSAQEPMPFIVVVIDELSDLMLLAGREIEDSITRIAQMARAAGIHLIVATQRPSVDVITGLIKVNFPSRISFRVTSKIDSRTILDCSGAEKLLGSGDMLFLDSTASLLKRVHGAYVSDAEIDRVVTHVKQQRPVAYQELQESLAEDSTALFDADDQLYQDVCAFLDTVDEISISLLQRRFRIGYNRSARLIDMLESEGHILPAQGGKMRKVVK